MQSVAVQDINQIVTTFELFINTYENSKQFLALRSNEEIKNSFKLAFFIEQTVLTFKSKNTLSKWMNVLDEQFKKQGKKYSCYNAEFFSRACDHLLKLFFKYKSIDINIIEISVRMYTTLLPRERCQKLLSDLLVTSASHKAILDFVLVNEGPHLRNLECKLVLNSWKKQYEMEKCNELVSTINEMLKFSKVEKALHIIIGILALENVSQVEKSVQQLILKLILKTMLNRSILGKPFWFTLFKVDKSDILKICKLSEDFLESICNFLIYIGSMMEFKDLNGHDQWLSNPNISICPELTYNDLLFLIKCLTNENFEKKEFLISKIRQAQVNTGSFLWTQIMLDL